MPALSIDIGRRIWWPSALSRKSETAQGETTQGETIQKGSPRSENALANGDASDA